MGSGGIRAGIPRRRTRCSTSSSVPTSRWSGGSPGPSRRTRSARRSWTSSAWPPSRRGVVRCFLVQVSATASVGQLVPGGLGYLRPPAEIELAAYGVDFRGVRVADIGAGEGRLALGAARRADRVLAIDPDRSALARGRAEAKRLGMRNITFREGAAQSLEP